MAALLLFVGAAFVSGGVAFKVDGPTGLIVAGVLALVAGIDASRDIVKEKRPSVDKETGRGAAVGPEPDE